MFDTHLPLFPEKLPEQASGLVVSTAILIVQLDHTCLLCRFLGREC